MKHPEIRCPQCAWRPKPESRWSCTPSCGTEWNTFWTGGVCPGCGHAWEKTQCLACQEISPHRKWYHYPSGASRDEKERQRMPEKASA